MSTIPAFDEPMKVEHVDGEVAITGPDGLCASFTVSAARESARRLTAAVEALEGEAPQTYQKPLG